MRQVGIVLAMLLAMGGSKLSAQDQCQGNYVSCVTGCVSGAKGGQDRCIESCQNRNNLCYAQKLGTPVIPGTRPAVVAQQPVAPGLRAIAAQPSAESQPVAEPENAQAQGVEAQPGEAEKQ